MAEVIEVIEVDGKEETDSMIRPEETLSKKEEVSKEKRLRVRQHCLILLKFFFFNVILVASDIGSDILTARNFFATKNNFWASLTLLFVFMPFLARIVIYLVDLAKCLSYNVGQLKVDRSRLKIQKQEFPYLIWHFPLLHPIRNFRSFIALFLIDTSLPQNSDEIRKIKEDALGSGLFEAFLESAPQFILQCSIIMRTGITTPTQLVSIAISFLSLALSSTKLFYSQRLGKYSEVDPSMTMIAFALPFVVCLMAGPLVSLILMASYYEGKCIIAIVTIMLGHSIVLNKIFKVRLDEKIEVLYCHPNKKYSNLNEEKKELGLQQRDKILLTAIFTAWISPCIVMINNIVYESNFLSISSITSFVGHIICLISIGMFVDLYRMSNMSNPPILHCFDENERHRFNESIYSFYTDKNLTSQLINFCEFEETCKPLIRICPENNSRPSDILYRLILPTAVALYIISLLASVCLQFMGNYLTQYKWSKKFNVTTIQYSLLHDSLNKDLLELNPGLDEELFEKAMKDNRYLLNVKDSIHGDTFFHLALTSHAYRYIAEAIQSDIDLSVKNDYDESVENLIKSRKMEDTFMKNLHSSLQTRRSRLISSCRVWKEQPIFKSIRKKEIKKIYILSKLGVKWLSKNDEGESVIDVLLKEMENDEKFGKSVFKLGIMNSLSKTIFLFSAAKNGFSKVLRFYFNEKINIENLDVRHRFNGNTALHIAAENNHLECAKLLIEQKANVNEVNFLEATPLHVAMKNMRIDIVELLVKSESDVNLTDKEKKTAAHILIEEMLNIEDNDIPDLQQRLNDLCLNSENFKNSLRVVVSQTDFVDEDGKSPLHKAAKEGKVNVLKFLTDYNADVNAIDKEGRTPIFEALNGEIVKLLIEKNAKVDVQNIKKSTPLHEAIKQLSFEIVEILVENDADLSLEDIDGKIPIQLLINGLTNLKDKSSPQLEIMFYDTLINNENFINSLKRSGADVNYKDANGKTPLHVVANEGNLKVVKFLTKINADLNATDNEGNTPLTEAVKKDKNDVVEFLSEHIKTDTSQCITSEEINKNSPGNKNCSAFQLAIEKGLFEMVKTFARSKSFMTSEDIDGNSPAQLLISGILNEISPPQTAFFDKLMFDENFKEDLRTSTANFNYKTPNGKTPLHMAAKEGKIKAVKFLIDLNADVNVLDNESCTPLFEAVIGGYYEVVQILINNKADVNIPNSKNYTPLHEAMAKQSGDIVQLLLTNNSDVNIKSLDGSTATHLLINGILNLSDDNAAFYESLIKEYKFKESLINLHADVDIKNAENQTPLHVAAKSGKYEVVQFLVEANADINSKDNSLETSLHKAIYNGHTDVAKQLIHNQAIVNSSCKFGNTPLHLAAERGDLECAKCLIENGADVNAKCCKGHTVLYRAVSKQKHDLVELLLQSNSHVNTKCTDGCTVLHLATQKGVFDFVKIFLAHNADVNIENDYNQTPLHIAVGNGKYDVVKCLIENKANVNAKNKDSKSPLHLAARWGFFDIVQLLIENKANVNERDNDENIPLHWIGASETKMMKNYIGSKDEERAVKCCEILIKSGADFNATNKFNKKPLDNNFVQILRRQNPDLFKK